jgi:hypothetical protein
MEILKPINDTKNSNEVGEELSLQLAQEAQQYSLDAGSPEEKIKRASECAKLIKHVMMSKKKPVIVNEEIYPELEDWLIAANFYGCIPKVVSTRFTTEYGAVGFEAVAELIRLSDGAVISRAESMCLMDEQRWSGKPMYAIRSMAQTRACAGVMRRVFSWILVLAGYRPTPAEEIKDSDITPKETPVKINNMVEE